VSRTLIIAEKPSVAADIAKVVGAAKKGTHGYEGDDHIVSWAVGHLLEFAPPEEYDERFKRWRLKDLPIIPEAFKLKATRGSTKQLTALKRFIKAKDVDLVINACDAGREGELIFREIYRYSGSKKPVKRLWLQSMTQDAIKKSLAAPRDASDVQGLADAADCRAESDWLIGMNATRALTVRLRSSRDRVVWSAGRVQTATLALVVRRELEILAHEPEPYWMIHADFSASDHDYQGTWFDKSQDGPKDRIFDEARRDAVIKLLESKPTATAAETRKDSKETAPPLFDLTSLQREANRRLGFSARRTLSIAQSLYEGHKLITYPRTDSRALPEDYEPQVMQAIGFLGGSKAYKAAADRLASGTLENRKRNFDNTAISDHFAIIPTGEGSLTGLRDDEKKVFDLIARRFLASFHPPAISTQVERITTIGEETFRTRLKVLKVPGWRACWDKGKDEKKEASLPPLQKPDVTLGEHTVEEKETNPPSRLNEASLLSLMETAGKEVDDAHLSKVLKETGGLGTPATRAETIETLLSRNYAERVSGLGGRKALRATARGIRLIDSLQRIPIEQLASPELTADLENSLKSVQDGTRQRDKYMDQVRDWTREIVEKIQGFTYDGLYDSEPVLGECPLCKTKVRETLRTYVCENGGKDGTCSFVIWKEVGGRYIDRKSSEQLVSGGETPVKSGFFSRDGREYEASLHLTDDGRVEIRSKGHGELLEASGERVEPADVGPCPFHPDEGWLVRRSALGYRCDGFSDKKCKVNLPLEVCKRPLSLEEVTGLIGKDRNTGLLENFTSKRGRPFSATLHLTDAGRLRFEFPPRGAGGGRNRKEFPVNEEPLGKCGSCNDGQIVETATDFKCTVCKVRVSREVCKREIKREEAAVLFSKKKSALLEGFTSRAGKPFNAFLKVKKSGGHRFEWADE